MSHLMEQHQAHVERRRRLYQPSAAAQAGHAVAVSERVREAQRRLRNVQRQVKIAEEVLSRLQNAVRQAAQAQGTDNPRYPVKLLLAIVAHTHDLPEHEVLSHRRCRPIVDARAHLISLLKDLRPDLSWPRIGQAVGGFDHSTVMHAVKRWSQIAGQYQREITAVNAALGITREVPFQ